MIYTPTLETEFYTKKQDPFFRHSCLSASRFCGIWQAGKSEDPIPALHHPRHPCESLPTSRCQRLWPSVTGQAGRDLFAPSNLSIKLIE
jgi:hypothetical protein